MSIPRLMPALVTPFDAVGDIDWTAFTFNLEVMRDREIEGVVLGGSTGEGSLLEPGERSRMVSEAGSATWLMVGVWAESIRQALTQIEESASADAILVATPTTLARTDLGAQIRFFTEIADRSPLPVFLYSVPRNTGYNLALEAIATLSEHDNIIGMKDSGGDAVRIQRIVSAAGTPFRVFNGASASTLLALRAGAYGAITASTNYLAGPMRALLSDSLDSDDALGLQNRMTHVTGVIESDGVPGVKVAARLTGLRPGYPRAPLAPPDQSDELRIKTALDRI